MSYSPTVFLGSAKDDTLAPTQSRVSKACNGNVNCSIHCADVTDSQATEKIAGAVGTWDVFILNAGYVPTPSPITSCDLDDY